MSDEQATVESEAKHPSEKWSLTRLGLSKERPVLLNGELIYIFDLMAEFGNMPSKVINVQHKIDGFQHILHFKRGMTPGEAAEVFYLMAMKIEKWAGLELGSSVPREDQPAPELSEVTEGANDAKGH